MYSIAIDPQANSIEITLRGLFDRDQTAAYIADVRRQMTVRGLRANYLMIVDVSDCPIQPQETVRAMGEHMAAMPKAERIAIVTGSSLARMQIRRLFTQPYARIAATMDEARGWALWGRDPVME